MDRAREVVGTSELTDAALRRFLHGLPGVDQVGAEARAADLSHPVDQDHRQGLGDRPGDLDDRPDDARGRRTPTARSARCAPRPARPTRPTRPAPAVAAICVYPDMVASAAERRSARQRRQRRGGRHRVPVRPGQPCTVKLADTRDAVAAGADEIDMVIDRGAFLVRALPQVFDEIVAGQGRPRRRHAPT